MEKKKIKPPKLPAGFRSLRSEANVKEDKNKIQEYDDRPSISFSETELPEIVDWKVKGKYKITILVEMNGTRIEDYGRNKDKTCASFRVDAVSVDQSQEKEK